MVGHGAIAIVRKAIAGNDGTDENRIGNPIAPYYPPSGDTGLDQ